MVKITAACSCFLLVIVLLFNGCAKEYSCEGAGCSDFGIFAKGCASLQLDGHFEQGQAVTASNSATLTVKANSPGSYTVETDNQNGVWFEASGSFADSGIYNLVMQAKGLPLDSGIFTYTLKGLDCSFPVRFAAFTPKADTFYYEANIDGQFFSARAYPGSVDSAWPTISVLVAGTDTATFKSIIGRWPVPPGTTFINIFKGRFGNYTNITPAMFKSYFAQGSYPYGNPDESSPLPGNGIKIYWIDPNGVVWHSDESNDQTGRSFQITACEDGAPSVHNWNVIVTAEFNCLLSDPDGNVKTLTNGKFRGVFRRI